MAIFSSFNIAERTGGSRRSLAFLRWALVIVFLWFGGMKFTSYEAHGNAPLNDHSPTMSWMNVAFGIQGASDLIGTIELATAAALITGAFVPVASALGAAMSAATFLVTLTFFVSTPGDRGADGRRVSGDLRADWTIPSQGPRTPRGFDQSAARVDTRGFGSDTSVV